MSAGYVAKMSGRPLCSRPGLDESVCACASWSPADWVSSVVGRLVKTVADVVVLDSSRPQAGPDGRPAELPASARLLVGDVQDRDAVRSAVGGVDAVVHLAAKSVSG
jgi:hypothetical protein